MAVAVNFQYVMHIVLSPLSIMEIKALVYLIVEIISILSLTVISLLLPPPPIMGCSKRSVSIVAITDNSSNSGAVSHD